jgi:hypothetical protein
VVEPLRSQNRTVTMRRSPATPTDGALFGIG